MPCTTNYKWEKSDILGAGAFGCVYKGTTNKSNKKVAVKTFQFTLDYYQAREANTLKMAQHKNVVKFFGLECIENSPEKVLIMECCDEGNLRNLIQSTSKGLSEDQFLRVLEDFVAAITYLREKELVHRDLKPENILIQKHGNKFHYKLADFGAARILKPNEMYGSLYGTAEYVHPDIYAKFYAHALNIIPPKNQFNDIHELWSIGVTLYEVATGKLPFKPAKGRADPVTMYQMTNQKSVRHISASEIDGQIKWSCHLPECELEDLKEAVTKLLVGLLQSSDENMWSFQHLSDEALTISSLKKERSIEKRAQKAKIRKQIRTNRWLRSRLTFGMFKPRTNRKKIGNLLRKL